MAARRLGGNRSAVLVRCDHGDIRRLCDPHGQKNTGWPTAECSEDRVVARFILFLSVRLWLFLEQAGGIRIVRGLSRHSVFSHRLDF